jgi:hypothetical protein
MRHLAVPPLLLLALAACPKDGGTASPSDGATPAPKQLIDPGVPQEPDPASIAEAKLLYLQGDYARIGPLLGTVWTDLRDRSQIRAGGLAAAWLALGLARDVAENAAEPAAFAAQMAAGSDDPELGVVAAAAGAAQASGVEDFAGAIAKLQPALALAAAPADARALAQAILGEAYIGRAFGKGDGKVENPADLEEARKAYDAGLALATGAASADLLLGRLHEGLAAVAKYQGKSADVCPHAKAAAEHYAKGGATPYLQEGPKALADEARCS